MLAHPSRSVEDTRRQLQEMGLPNHAVILKADSGGLEQDRQLISTGWDLAELAQGYRRFVAGFDPVREILACGVELSAELAFVVRSLLIHEYRKIHLRDPLLPRGLLPQDWIGAAAYEVCQDLYRRVYAAAEVHLSTQRSELEWRACVADAADARAVWRVAEGLIDGPASGSGASASRRQLAKL